MESTERQPAAVMSFVGLRKNQGKREEARVIPTTIYDSFTDRLDTLDLREAKNVAG